jgi:hypothetical protein
MTARDAGAVETPVVKEIAHEPQVSEFYTGVFDHAELLAAARVEGIDDELAVLRLRLREQWKKSPLDMTTALKAMEILIRALGVRHRISRKRLDDLNEAVATLIHTLAPAIDPAEEEI